MGPLSLWSWYRSLKEESLYGVDVREGTTLPVYKVVMTVRRCSRDWNYRRERSPIIGAGHLYCCHSSPPYHQHWKEQLLLHPTLDWCYVTSSSLVKTLLITQSRQRFEGELTFTSFMDWITPQVNLSSLAPGVLIDSTWVAFVFYLDCTWLGIRCISQRL